MADPTAPEPRDLPATMLEPVSFDDSPEPATTEDSYWKAEAQRARAERDALALRLLQMADAWEERFTETGIRVDAVVSAVRMAVENMGGRS